MNIYKVTYSPRYSTKIHVVDSCGQEALTHFLEMLRDTDCFLLNIETKAEQ